MGEAVAEAMENLKDTEFSRAQEVWRKKFGTPPQDPHERAKHMRFLITRGFNAEVVRRVVKSDGLVDDPSD
jgi:regulatory protein